MTLRSVLGDRLGRHAEIQAAHEVAFRIHDVDVGAVVDDVVAGACPGGVALAVGTVLRGGVGDLLRAAGQPDDAPIECFGVLRQDVRRVALGIDGDEDRLQRAASGPSSSSAAAIS